MKIHSIKKSIAAILSLTMILGTVTPAFAAKTLDETDVISGAEESAEITDSVDNTGDNAADIRDTADSDNDSNYEEVSESSDVELSTSEEDADIPECDSESDITSEETVSEDTAAQEDNLGAPDTKATEVYLACDINSAGVPGHFLKDGDQLGNIASFNNGVLTLNKGFFGNNQMICIPDSAQTIDSVDVYHQAMIYADGDLTIEVNGGTDGDPLTVDAVNDKNSGSFDENNYARDVYGIYVNGNLTIRNAKGHNGALKINEKSTNLSKQGGTYGIHCSGMLRILTQDDYTLSVTYTPSSSDTGACSCFGIYASDVTIGSNVNLNIIGKNFANVSAPKTTSVGIRAYKNNTLTGSTGEVKIGSFSKVTAIGGNMNTESTDSNGYTRSAGIWAAGKVVLADDSRLLAQSGTVNTNEFSFSNKVRMKVDESSSDTANATATLSINPLNGLYYDNGKWYNISTSDIPDDLFNWLNTVDETSTKTYSLGDEAELSVLTGDDFYSVPQDITANYRVYALRDELCTGFNPENPAVIPLNIDSEIYMNSDRTYNLCFMKNEDMDNPVTKIELFAENLPDELTPIDRCIYKDHGDKDFRITSFSPNVFRASFEYMMSGISTSSADYALDIEDNNAYYAYYRIDLADGLRYDELPEVTMNGEKMIVSGSKYGSRDSLAVFKKYTLGTPPKCKFTIDLNGKGELPAPLKSSYEFEKGQRMVDFLSEEELEAIGKIGDFVDASGNVYAPHWHYKDRLGNDATLYDISMYSTNALLSDTPLRVEWVLRKQLSGRYDLEFEAPAAGMTYDSKNMEYPDAKAYYIDDIHATSMNTKGMPYQYYLEGIFTAPAIQYETLMKRGSLFEKDKSYYALFYIFPNEDLEYYFDNDDMPEFYVNGEKQELIINTEDEGLKKSKPIIGPAPSYNSSYYFFYKFTPGKETISLTIDCNYPDGTKGSIVMTDIPAGIALGEMKYGIIPIEDMLLMIGDMTYDQYLKYNEEYEADESAFMKKHSSFVLKDCVGYQPYAYRGAVFSFDKEYPLTISDADWLDDFIMDKTLVTDTTLYLLWYKEVDFIGMSNPIIPCCGDRTYNYKKPAIDPDHMPYVDLYDWNYTISNGFEITDYYFTDIDSPSLALNNGDSYDFEPDKEYLLHMYVTLSPYGPTYNNYLWAMSVGSTTKLLYNGKEYTGTAGMNNFSEPYVKYEIPVKAEHKYNGIGGKTIKDGTLKDPTCEEDGSVDIVHNYTCDKCGTVVNYTEHRIIPRLGHIWGEWEVVQPPTYETNGLARRVCTTDKSHVETRVIHSLGGTSAVTGISLGSDALTLKIGEKVALEANVEPDNATEKAVSFSSDNPAVAPVDSDGMITGKKPGSAKITVTTKEGGFTASCQVTVTNESYGDDKNTTRISPEDLDGYVFPGRTSKTVISAPVKVSGNEVKGLVTIEYNDAAAYTGGAIKPDTGTISANVILDGFVEAANLKVKNTAGLFAVSYKSKNNKKPGSSALFYPVIKADSKTLKALNLSKQHKKEFKALLKAMNAALKADPCKFTINKASLVDLKNGMEFVPAFDKSGAPMMDKKTNMPKIKSIKVKLDPKSTKLKKLSNKSYVVEAYDKEAGTVRIKGAGDFTGTITMKLK